MKDNMKEKKSNRKNYDRYLSRISDVQEKFLIERFRCEWLELERTKNREEFLKKLKARGIKSGKALLGLAAIAGVITIAAVAPNMLVAFGGLNKQAKWFFNKDDLESNLTTNRKNSYIKIKKDGDLYRVELTDKGRKVLLRSLAKDMKVQETKKWDGKWWLVTFDIPRKHNAERDLFRQKLKMIGMGKLQESVFVCRNDCREEIFFWASLYSINDFIHVAKAEFLTGFNI